MFGQLTLIKTGVSAKFGVPLVAAAVSPAFLDSKMQAPVQAVDPYLGALFGMS